MSYASMGSSAVLNLLHHGSMLMVAEGLDLMRLPVPRAIAGATVATSHIRGNTGCSIVGVRTDGRMNVNPAPDAVLNVGDELVVIGPVEAGRKFLAKYPPEATNHS